MNMKINPEPLGRSGRIAALIMLLGLISIWVFAFYAYSTLPERVPVHFGTGGDPTRYGEKSEFILIALSFSIAPILILLVARYRFVLINRYPYLVNLPAFYTNIHRLHESRRAYWVNRYFEAVLWLGTALTLYLVALEYTIYLSQIQGRISGWALLIAILFPVFMLFPFLYMIFRISWEMSDEAGKDAGNY